MRLICPNCGAQYEVSDDVIPAQGRDVQCSNCGHTWFESPGASVAAEEELHAPEPVVEEAPAPAPAPEPEPEPEPEPTPEPEPAAEEPPTEADEEEEASAPPDLPPRKTIDDSIAQILRAEAAREEANRAAEAETGLQRQDDLGLDEMPTMTETKKAESAERISRLKGEEPAASVAAAVAETVAGSRRELLPDIDDINATLRSESERDAPPPLPEEEEAEERRGFRFGFFGVLMVFAVLIAIYVFADQIIAAVPALEGVLNAYVAAVDSLRIWFDVQMQKLLVMLEGQDG